MAALTPLPAAASAPRALAAPAAIASRLNLVIGRLSPGAVDTGALRSRVGHPTPCRRRHERLEQAAVLTRLGVPLHRDPEARRGVLHRLERAVGVPRGRSVDRA